MTHLSWLLTGGAIGILNFLTLCWTVAHFRPDAPRHAVAWAVGGALVRWSLAAGLLIIALRHGVLPGLLAFAGLWLGRWGTVYQSNRRPPSREMFEI